MSQDPVILDIVPCIDSLLYAPIYLALVNLALRHGIKPRENDAHLEIPKVTSKGSALDGCKLEVNLLAPANGDVATLTKVNVEKRDHRHVVVGVCDPITVVKKNIEETGSEEPIFQIPGVFVDRIALSLATRTFKANWRPPRDESKRLRDISLRELLVALKKRDLNYEATIEKWSSRLNVSVWRGGETTEFIAKHLLKLSKSSLRPDSLTDGGSYDFDIDGLERGAVDVAITHAPWLVEKLEKIELLSRECFPCVQFPFSGVVVKTQAIQEPVARDVVRLLIQSIHVAIAFIHRFPADTCAILGNSQEFFRRYGIVDQQGEVDRIIRRAINGFLVNGCFCESLCPAWAAWEWALSMGSSPTTNVADDVWMTCRKTLPMYFINELDAFAKDPEQLRRQLRDLKISGRSILA